MSVLDDALRANLTAGEFRDGAAGPGLDRLEATLDAASLPKGALLYDRHVRPAAEPLARGLGGTPVAANDDSLRPDDIYVIVEHGHAPATYKAVLGWRQRQNDIQSPSSGAIIIR